MLVLGKRSQLLSTPPDLSAELLEGPRDTATGFSERVIPERRWPKRHCVLYQGLGGHTSFFYKSMGYRPALPSVGGDCTGPWPSVRGHLGSPAPFMHTISFHPQGSTRRQAFLTSLDRCRNWSLERLLPPVPLVLRPARTLSCPFRPGACQPGSWASERSREPGRQITSSRSISSSIK